MATEANIESSSHCYPVTSVPCGGTHETQSESHCFHTAHEDNPTVTQQYPPTTFLQYAAIRQQADDSTAIERYATRSLLAALGDTDVSTPLAPAHLRLWIATMMEQRLTSGSITRYFRKLHTLYRQHADGLTADDPFDAVRSLLDTTPCPATPQHGSGTSTLQRLLPALTARAHTDTALQVFLYMVYTATFDLSAVLSLRLNGLSDLPPQLQPILDPDHRHHRATYLFPLQQNRRRPAQIMRELTVSLTRTLTGLGMSLPPAGFSTDTVKKLWIQHALSASESYPDIHAMTGTMPAAYAHLSIVPASQLTPAQRSTMAERVAASLHESAPHWYAMRLRPHADPLGLQTDTRAILPQGNRAIQYYYPTTRRATRQEHRIHFDTVPVLPGIMFFKTRSYLLPVIHRAVRHRAWIYRHSNAPDSPYSIIPTREMRILQRAIGQLTPGTELSLSHIDPTELQPGRRVRITGGPMAGYEGVIHDIRDPQGNPTDRRLITLTLSTRSAMTWHMTIPEPLITPLP